MQFNEWTVLEYVGNSKWKCQCSCKSIGIVRGADLKSGASIRCKTHPKENKIDKIMGTLRCVEYIPPNIDNNTEALYKFVCIECGNTYYIKPRNATEKYIRKCDCQSNRDKLDDLSGKKFGFLTVDRYIGNKQYLCTCVCNNTKIVRRQHLINGHVKSCGCKSTELFKEAVFDKYGETNISKINNPRSEWQIYTVSSRSNLLDYIKSLGKKPSIKELCELLNLNKTNMYLKIHEYGLENHIEVDYSQSDGEKQIANFISTLVNIQTHNKSIISPYELDIYIPDKRIAIEYNGLYWHSELYKDKYYHQNKTLECAKKGIRLIHIFEDEWVNNTEKIKEFLISILSTNKTIIGARKTYVKNIDDVEYTNFLDMYHLKGSVGAEIKLGCYICKTNELVGIMSFSKPRFNNNYEYELVRLCWRYNVAVIGGTEKLFKHFINKFNVSSIITYSDISKFTGNTYLKLGFLPVNNKPITEPNYIWSDGDNSISRYATQKHKLVQQGFGTDMQTESEIMHSRGFYKVYDSGNIKLEWKRR